MGKMTEEKQKNLKNAVFKSLLFFIPVSFAYIAAVALNTNSDATANASFATLLLKNLAFLFAFSLIFGFSFLIFKAKKLQNAAKWSLHIFLLYAALTATAILMTGNSDDPSAMVLLVFIVAMLFAVIYSLSALFVYLIRRRKH